jgi:hypothetical protein
MWKRVKLPLSLAVFVPALALLGGFLTLDTGEPTWWGLTVGAAIGVFFGFVFGGNSKWKVWDYIYGPAQPSDRTASEAHDAD